MKKDEILEIKIEGYEIRIFEKKSHEKQKQIPIFYMPVLSMDQGDKIWSLIKKDCILVMIVIEHWNKDLSPWRAKKIFLGGEDFDGEGNRFCNILISKELPAHYPHHYRLLFQEALKPPHTGPAERIFWRCPEEFP